MAKRTINFNFKADELVKAGRTTIHNIEGIQAWLELLPTIPALPDEQVAIFLIACVNDTEATKNCILNYFKLKAASPEIFSGKDVDGNELSTTVSKMAILPKRTKENYAIAVGSLRDTSYSKFNIDTEAKYLMSLIDLVLYENIPNGLIAVIDMKGVGLMHLTRLKIATVKKFFQFLQEALPSKLKYIFILNSSYVFDKVLMLFKPFLNKELFEMIITHAANEDMDEFYKTRLSQEYLPSDYGGSLPNMEQLSMETKQQWRKLQHYLNETERQIEIYRENNSD